MFRKVIPRPGVQWVTVHCPVWVWDEIECRQPVEVKVRVENEVDDDGGIRTDYIIDHDELKNPCGHTYTHEINFDALYELVVAAVLDGE